MNSHLDFATQFIEDEVYSQFEMIWENVIDMDTVPSYRILVWGSTVDTRDRDPNDLDIIIEYDHPEIEPERAKSIEKWLHNSLNPTHFNYVDPIVIQYHQTPHIVAESKSSKVYSVDENGFLEF